jgi:PAS domain S-box-containing protein
MADRRDVMVPLILVLAPLGRDGTVICDILRPTAFSCEVVPDTAALVARLDVAATAVIAEEAFASPADLERLGDWLQVQEPWSDFPFVLLALPGEDSSPPRKALADRLGNITVLERPLRPDTLVRAVVAGARARRRQYETARLLQERARAEAKLRESEEHYRNAAELNPQVAWTADPDGQLDRVAERWREWTGTTGLGATWSEGLHPDDRPHTFEAWRQAVASGEPYDVEHRVKRLTGVYRWARSRASPRRDDAGRIVKWYGSTEDVHDRKQAEEGLYRLTQTLERQVADRTAALRASEARLRTIFETSYQYQALVSLDGILLDANATLLGNIGRDLTEVVGRPFADLPWFAETPSLADDMRQAVETVARGETVRREITTRLPAGWRTFDFEMRPMRDQYGDVVALVPEAVDITERRHAEEALRQSQKLEAMGQLTGGVAHDFNNLLTPIMGSLDLLHRRRIGGEREQRLIDGALQAAERAKMLVQRLLAFARRQPLRSSAVDVGSLITGMRDLVASTSGPRISVEVEADPVLPPAKADANQLEMAILNLSVNARDAMPDGGALRITAATETVGPGHRSKLSPGPYIRLSVADTGGGMDEATLARAIEPFFSTKGVGKGTGLGLSMVHGLVAQLGGALTIASAPGRGTDVELWLPVSDRAADPVEPAVADVALGGSGKALLVDDEDLVRASAADMLVDLGYTVTEAGSAAKALDLIEHGLTPDFIMTDHLMPGMNGTDFARIIRQRLPDVPVLIVSGYAETAGIAADLPRLNKPFRRKELAARLCEMLGASEKRPR